MVCGLASHTSRSNSHVTHPSFIPPFQVTLTSRGDCYRIGALGVLFHSFSDSRFLCFYRYFRNLLCYLDLWLFIGFMEFKDDSWGLINENFMIIIFIIYFGRYGCYICYILVPELVSHLGSDPRGVLRPVMGSNEDVAFFERGWIVTSCAVICGKDIKN